MIGQFGESEQGNAASPAYVDDPTVPNDSLTPTFAAARLRIHNERWDGVPFL